MPERQATLRAAARLGLALLVPVGLVPKMIATVMLSAAAGGFRIPIQPNELASWLAPLLALVALWASGRAERRGAALGFAGAVLVTYLIMAGQNIVQVVRLGGVGLVFWATVTSLTFPLGVVAAFALSYRAPRGREAVSRMQVDAQEALRVRSPWMLHILLPMIALVGLYYALVLVTPAPQGTFLGVILASGLAYRWMLRRHPRAGAGSWLQATLLLVVLNAPAYAYFTAVGVDNEYLSLAAAILLTLALLGMLALEHRAGGVRTTVEPSSLLDRSVPDSD